MRLRERDLLGGGQQLVAADVGEEELQAVGGARERLVRLPARRGLRPPLGDLGLRLAHLEADRLELARQLLDLVVGEIVLERERLELRLLDVAALLRRLDDRAAAFALKELLQLVLRQLILS